MQKVRPLQQSEVQTVFYNMAQSERVSPNSPLYKCVFCVEKNEDVTAFRIEQLGIHSFAHLRLPGVDDADGTVNQLGYFCCLCLLGTGSLSAWRGYLTVTEAFNHVRIAHFEDPRLK